MTTWTISINDELKEAAEKAMKEGKYGNKSEFIRTLIRKFCVESEQIDYEKENERLVDLITEKISQKNPKDFPSLDEVLARV